MFFFSQKPFGLDISDRSLEMVLFGGSFSRPKVLAMSRIVLKDGVVRDGQVVDKKGLAESLLQLVSKPQFGSIKTKDLIFSLPDSKMFLFFVDQPKRKDTEKNRQINFLKTAKEKAKENFPYNFLETAKEKAKENFPYNEDELYWSVKSYGQKGALVVAVPKKIVNDFIDVFKIVKINPLALEPEAESLFRSLVEVNDKDAGILLVDIGSRTTNLTIFEGSKLMYSFLINRAGDSFTNAITKTFGISAQQAESLKVKVGLNPDHEEGKVFLALQPEMREIVAKIKEIINFFQERTGKNINRVVLTGGSSQMPSLEDYFRDNLQVKIVLGDPWDRINIDILKRKEYLKEALLVNPLAFTGAAGLAMRALLKNPKEAGINLLKDVK